MSEPAFSAPGANTPTTTFRQYYIDRRFEGDPDEAAARIAKEEGYKVIRFATKETEMKWGLVYKTIRIVVEPAYSARTGVPGCCQPGAMPDHYPNPSCRSGKRPHCTCDGCF